MSFGSGSNHPFPSDPEAMVRIGPTQELGPPFSTCGFRLAPTRSPHPTHADTTQEFGDPFSSRVWSGSHLFIGNHTLTNPSSSSIISQPCFGFTTNSEPWWQPENDSSHVTFAYGGNSSTKAAPNDCSGFCTTENPSGNDSCFQRQCPHPTPSNAEVAPMQTQQDPCDWLDDIAPQGLVVETEQRWDVEDQAQWASYQGAFQDERRQILAFRLSKQHWLRCNEEEPSIRQLLSIGLPVEAILPRDATSIFEAFHEHSNGYRCLVFDNGQQCGHRCPRKERAIAHARAHFEYKPFACAGQCRTSDCTRRYHSQALLNDHQNRKLKPMRTCNLCGEALTCQNLGRHIATRHSETGGSSQGAQPVATKVKKRQNLMKLRTKSNFDTKDDWSSC